MKNIILAGSFITLLFSCSDNSSSSASAGDTNNMSVQIPATACFRSVSGKDTVELKVETFPNVITGTLSYRYHEKDANTGDIEGIRMGDTLLADYTFVSEGVKSTRQVIFLLKSNSAIEGYGEMMEEDGKMMFKSLSNIDFTKSTPLQIVSCIEDVEVQAIQANDESKNLYRHAWQLSAIDGKTVTITETERLPELNFIPGQANTVSGTTGCNRLTGNFQVLANNAIKFSPMATTKMACMDENLETPFLEALAKVNKFFFNDRGLLLLLENDKVVLEFSAKQTVEGKGI